MERESKYLEYKLNIESKTYLKTISAFANDEGGEIIFGIADDYTIVGITDCEKACLDIENSINGNFAPRPEYQLTINPDKTIVLAIAKGKYTPYLYKGKAYKRYDSSTVEVTKEELKQLVLKGENLSFEQLPSRNQLLKFNELETKMIEVLDIHKLTKDIQKILGLFTDEGDYNIAAELVSDSNTFPGIDIIKFGNNISEIEERINFEHESIIKQLDETIEIYKRYYQVEVIETTQREIKDRVPERAFRETIANALVHRMWDIKSSIRISFFDDRIEVVSPGGLPVGISKDEYLDGMVSMPRNEIISGIFYRLKYIEKFGTGILRIKDSYQSSMMKPEFYIYDNSIKVVLPVMRDVEGLSKQAEMMYQILASNPSLSRIEIENLTNFSKDKTIRILNELLNYDIVVKEGSGRATKYRTK